LTGRFGFRHVISHQPHPTRNRLLGEVRVVYATCQAPAVRTKAHERASLGGMTTALETALARAGLRIDAAKFLDLLENTARRLSPVNPDPSHYFSPRQRAALTEAGLDLSPLAAGEPDARARTVAVQAVLAESALTVNEAALA